MDKYLKQLNDFAADIISFETHWFNYFLILIPFVLIYLFIMDVFFNKSQTIRHNFPVVGRLRYFLESIGPELRQYIVANNREELPFNRSQRSWVYASSKRQNNYEGFGSDKDFNAPGHIFINPSLFPYQLPPDHINTKDPYFVPCAKVMGLANNRKRPFRPYSIANVSAMSFGSLSPAAITALNQGAKLSGCYHNTGEGGLSPYHSFGADVIFQIGTGYFGVRDAEGNFSMDRLEELVSKNPFVKAIEVKLSQGAKPGKGGVLPGKKITKELALVRNVPMGKDVISPVSHKAFKDIPQMLEFFEKIAEKTHLPIGFKAAVGKLDMWEELADLMVKNGTGPDFITIDGGEGGTGAAPHAFADHVSLPLTFAFASVYKIFAERNLTDKIVFIASGKLGFPANAVMAFAMGADCINVAREAMLSIGCIQAQKCHTNICPAGIATQNKWLQSGLDPRLKSIRYQNYNYTLRKEILELSHACNYQHPAQFTMSDLEISQGDSNLTQPISHTYHYQKVPVIFNSMEELYNCPYLGGLSNNYNNTFNLKKELV